MRTEAETKQKATDTASSHCGSRAGVRSEAEYAGVADAGRTRAAEGTTRRHNWLLWVTGKSQKVLPKMAMQSYRL
ncbi:hypothetical protein sS8_4883 [Methylocaldum marinum]|uniref:Uncharacterized protein n=1 Tax=Methylocaldum marinum TaxID=1432792 RepID=A0A250KZ64_9GAMM|nr:hypothetical protein sS8_4883 [Methylocaldum marinum]